MKEKAAALVDCYARRMLVENAIEDAINFFSYGCTLQYRAAAH